MSDFKIGDHCRLNKPPHIIEGVIIMPGSPVQIHSIEENGTYSVLYLDKEQMPHILKEIQPSELSAQ